ncbi:hypothetical protein JCM25156A_24300 [Komagataeibacter kakiaceti JCM 25156]
MEATMALSDDRALDRIRCGARPEFPLSVAAGFCVYRGAITAVCQDGTAVPAGSTGTPSPLVAIMGIARGRQDNSGTSQVYGDQSGPGPAWIEKDAFALAVRHGSHVGQCWCDGLRHRR